MRVRFSARSHVGMRREVNQDAYDGRQLGPATLLVVCDGMGGHVAGEVASQIGVETIIATYSVEMSPEESLRTAFVTANQRIYGEGRGSMGTTGVAALFLRNTLHVANVGDSRAYLVREGQISQISQDHSFVFDQVAAGLMTPEQARSSNIRNIITRALGHSSEVEVDLFAVDLQAGDTVLLSSDGMHGLITDEEIAEVAAMFPPDEAAQRLVDLANGRGGTDNITVVIAQVDELDPSGEVTAAEPAVPVPAAAPAPSAERPLSRLGLTLASLTLVALLGLGGYLWASGVASRA
ncbi:MAG: serine/threonine-protein phosphatase, partial [Chloroflexales bacterium]|nr:serine/threonine-protein phosphatase [Chloroflexales bacterium]